MTNPSEELLLLRAIKKLRTKLDVSDSSEDLRAYLNLVDCLIHLRLKTNDERN